MSQAASRAPKGPMPDGPPPRRRASKALLAGLLFSFACAPEGIVGITTEIPVDVDLYETYEFSVRGRQNGSNPFTQFVEATFTLDEQRIFVEGFYDGNGTWKVRFTPEEAGEWHYEWRFGDQTSRGVLRVSGEPWRTRPQGTQPASRHHGRVYPRGEDRIRLIHADGSPHYWMGAKWFSAKNYGPEAKGGEINEREESGSRHDAYYSDETFYEFLDTAAQHGLTGMLLKVGLFPLEDDGISWDLGWLRRADRWISAMNERGVYCKLTLFEPWSRRRGSAFEYSLDSSEHVLDAWSPERAFEKENYIRYALARFSGYSNVYWELANRVRHPGFDERTFLEQARENYVPWFERYDPYGVAVALSDVDQARALEGIHIEVPRYNTHLPAPPESRKARIVNELIHDCGPVGTGARAYRDATIRDGSYRTCYRSAAWIAFTSGAYGSTAASWLDLSIPLTPPVHEVLSDLGRLQGFIRQLPMRHDALLPDARHVVLGPGHLATRSQRGRLYVSYFQGPTPPGEVMVEVTTGLYEGQWIDPATGHILLESTTRVRHTGQGRHVITVPRPAFQEDAALLLQNTAAPLVR